MLKYELMGDNDYIFDPIGTIFTNRGIEDTELFLNIDKKASHDYKLLKNIDLAVESLLKHIDNKSNILIVVDPDVDGFSSATIVYQYIKLIEESTSVTWILHDDKSHGIEKITIPEGIDLIILPDSGSGDFDRHKELRTKGIDIIVLDHHEVKKESKNAIIVNPQICNYPNFNLSGAGVVIKFCEALDESLNVDYSNYFYDLVALGNIADSMSMKEMETRYYVQEGLKEINNDFFNALIKKQEYSLGGKLNITAVSFYIAPLINSVIRISNLNEKKEMFKAFLGVKELVKYKPRGGEETSVPLVDDVARRCANSRAKQNRIRDKIVGEIENYIEENELYNNKVIFVSGIAIAEKGLTGLVANVIAAKYKRPAIILSNIDDKGFGKGSGRGYDKGGIENFKDKIIQTRLFEYAEGHQGAFGVKIHQKYFDKVNAKLNEMLFDYDIDDKYNVDFDIKASSLSPDLIYTINELEDYWGKDIDEPYLVVKDIPIADAEVTLMGKKEDTIAIVFNGIKYMKFKTNQETYEEVLNAKKVSVVGKAKVNIYKDVLTPQIAIDKMVLLK
ncbi:DHH family phosphoesterase [Bacillus sp. T33-2]|uniref:DHH family phosphoesterase n=1 Tax=Bacillus sp. T33-2 TaxID=2054168 RepID=UPI000C756826|nr:DHH family phosphoesterase [Bacillus sp. T33-2]PLR99517.1 single-stranded-DNA-specific exonuclease RecJ [Bacillus sp. T33-2]